MSSAPQQSSTEATSANTGGGADDNDDAINATIVRETWDGNEYEYPEEGWTKLIRDAEAAPDAAAFWRQRDRQHGATILHFCASAFGHLPDNILRLCQQAVRADPKLGQELDRKGNVPLAYWAAHLMDNGDDWTAMREWLSEGDESLQTGVGVPDLSDESVDEYEAFPECLFQAYPEGLLAAHVLEELHVNPPGVESEPESDDDEESGERPHVFRPRTEGGRVLLGILHAAFGRLEGGFHHIQEDPAIIQKTGLRNPLHIMCSYAYLPAVGQTGLINRFVTPKGAATPDALVDGGKLLPLHLALSSPRLPRGPYPNGTTYYDSDQREFRARRVYNACIDDPKYKTGTLSDREKESIYNVVVALVQAHPEALLVPTSETSTTLSDGMLPLHIACESYYDDVALIEYLVEQEPRALTIADGQGRLPWEVATNNNCSVEILNYLIRACPDQLQPLSASGADTDTTAQCKDDPDSSLTKSEKKRSREELSCPVVSWS